MKFDSLVMLIILLNNVIIITGFSPNFDDFDAYGIKIAANDVLFVQANGEELTYIIQFAPYNYTFDSLQCTVDYEDEAQYVYSVGVGQKQNTTLNPYFYFAGEVTTDDFSGTSTTIYNRTFIGIMMNYDQKTVAQYITLKKQLNCSHFGIDRLEFISSYQHQEFFVIAVEPYGSYAIGLATSFGFTFRRFGTTTLTIKSSYDIWPQKSVFSPCAADASETFTIVAGFVENSKKSRVRATPTVYLIWNTNLTVLSTWSYNATTNSWQSRLTYSDVSNWKSKYAMSVKINPDDPTRVLVGMAFINTVFLFVVNNDGTSLTLTSSIDNGRSTGFGKSVTWLTNSQAAILASTYSLNYETWYSSKVYLYTSLNDTTIPSSPSAVIPNPQQPIPSTINSELIRMVSTPASLGILDIDGGGIIILNEPPGYYASTDTTYFSVAAAMPVISYSKECIGGTYKPDSGVHPCMLCPSRSRNEGQIASISCTMCSSDGFCPLGAVYEISLNTITSISQASAYPRSPERTGFEDILLNNMFSLSTTSRCLLVSPVFWTLILLLVFIILLITMASLNCCVKPSQRDQFRSVVKSIFQRTDLVVSITEKNSLC